MTTPGIYPMRLQKKKQAQYARQNPKEGTEGLIRAVLAVVPKDEAIIDLGAGTGRHVKRLREEGYECIGVDGTPDIRSLSNGCVYEYDLTGDRLPGGHWDWALFYDVGEHVPREHEQRLIDNICKIPRKGMIISWGYPHERGWNHVNCRTQVYVACEFAKRGFWPDDELTQIARDASKFPKHHIRLFVARKRGNDEIGA